MTTEEAVIEIMETTGCHSKTSFIFTILERYATAQTAELQKEVERVNGWYDKMKEDFDKMYQLALSKCTPEEIEAKTKYLKEILNL